RRRDGWNHAPRSLGLRPRTRLPRRPGLRNPRNLRTPPPPLRVQPRVRGHPHRRRPPHHRHHPRLHLRRNRRDPHPPLLPPLPVPPQIQIQAAGAPPHLPRLHRRQLPEPPRVSPSSAGHLHHCKPVT